MGFFDLILGQVHGLVKYRVQGFSGIGGFCAQGLVGFFLDLGLRCGF